jgi:hypothetical protein
MSIPILIMSDDHLKHVLLMSLMGIGRNTSLKPRTSQQIDCRLIYILYKLEVSSVNKHATSQVDS